MVKIRLRRTGAKHKPSYRVVVADSRSPRDGRLIEIVGHYNPLTEPETLVIEKDRISTWLSKGAQPTDTVRRLLAKAGLVEPAPIRYSTAKPKAEETAEQQPAAESTSPPAA